LKDDPVVGSYIVDIRGRGLMVGVEFASPKDGTGMTKHGKGMASKIAQKCIENGMLILTTSIYEVIRFIPPLNLTKEEMRKGCDIFAESVREVVEIL
jgi:4-aminobutyrate aminotransferase